MKIKVVFAAAALACPPLALAERDAAYPNENVAAFVVEKLDMTSLPSEIRPRKVTIYLRARRHQRAIFHQW